MSAPPRSSVSRDPKNGLLAISPEELGEYKKKGLVSEFVPASKLLQFHKSEAGCLFPQLPKLDDINQRGIGDCWFLAALVAIVNEPEGANFICRMMLDTGSDVLVRLYDEELIPHYISMKREIIFEVGTTAQRHADTKNGLWPAFLEKALTAFDRDGKFDPKNASYERTEGGQSHRAFRCILGVPGEARAVKHPTKSLETVLTGELSSPRNLAAAFGTADEAFNKDCGLWFEFLAGSGFLNDLDQAFEAVKGDTISVLKPVSFGDQVLSFFKAKAPPEIEKISTGKVYRLEDFNKVIGASAERFAAGLRAAASQAVAPARKSSSAPAVGKAPAPSPEYTAQEKADRFPDLAAAMKRWTKEAKFLPGKVGTTDYSLTELSNFEFIKAKRLVGPVCLGSSKYVGKSDRADRGQSANEPMVRGLVGKHAYAVLDTYEASGYKCVLVANPWGEYGRTYAFLKEADKPAPVAEFLATVHNDKIVDNKGELRLAASDKGLVEAAQHGKYAVDQGMFLLDLHDLSKRFDNIYYCEEAPRLEL